MMPYLDTQENVLSLVEIRYLSKLFLTKNNVHNKTMSPTHSGMIPNNYFGYWGIISVLVSYKFSTKYTPINWKIMPVS